MATCKDCIHYEVCRYMAQPDIVFNGCVKFKNKSDLTEIVRCKECKHWEAYEEDERYGECFMLCRNANGNDFCSYGEKKESEGEI